MFRNFKQIARLTLVVLAVISGLIAVQPASIAQATTKVAHVPVLMYHYIDQAPAGNDPGSVTRRLLTVTPANFDQQMAWLQAHHYVTITADQMVAAFTQNTALPTHSVLLTFDDGYVDAFTTVFPTLRKYGLIGTFFIVTNWIDAGTPGYLTWDQVRAMAAAGMSIEAHTRDHKSLNSADAAWLKNEIDGSATDIQTHLGTRPDVLAYPSGAYNGLTLTIARQSGMKIAFTTYYGIANAYSNRLIEPRMRIRYETSLPEFAAAVHWTDYWTPGSPVP